MFEEFYEMYEPEEQEVVALINRCIGGGFNWKGNFWEMTVVTLGIVFCDTGKVSTKEERLDWPVTEEERNSDKGWGRFGKEQICRLKIRRMKEERAKDLVVRPWCISEIVNAHEDCPELQAVLDEYHKPVVIQDQVLGELTLDKDYDTFEGEIRCQGKNVLLSLEVNAESKPSWTRARGAAKKLLADCETWDKAMRELAAKNLTGLANDWLSQDEENPRNPETDPITEEEFARRISMTSLSVTSGGSFTAWFDCDEMFTDHAVTVYGSLKKGLKAANIEGWWGGVIDMKLNCKRIDFTYTPGEEIFTFPEESGLSFIFDVEEELTADPAAMDAVGKMLDEAEELAEKAKAAIQGALADEDSPYHSLVTYFMQFHRDEVPSDIAAELFPGTDPAKLSFAEMVDFLRLKRFGSWVDGETNQQAFILDLSFNPEITDELMVVYFDLNQEIFCITHES